MPDEPSGDPVQSALRWVAAYRTVSRTDPSPTAWVERTRPLSTARLSGELARAEQGSPGADWPSFVARGCRTVVDQLDGTIPDEAPRTATTVYVQVSARAVTRCAAQRRDPPTVEDLSFTLAMTRGDDGAWRVSRHLF